MINIYQLNFANITVFQSVQHLYEKGKRSGSVPRTHGPRKPKILRILRIRHTAGDSMAVFVKAGARKPIQCATQPLNNFYETSGSISHPLGREMSKGGKPRSRNQAGNCSVSGPG
jgi:hypothetical protein